ncbi:hypothetical protein EBN03_26150 [Nocardia stercoris]|uniref:DNA-binding protein n=1 Tax=Nocardia stercoris TaxID=2483361 RepID=A0A3M2KX58_9NOCA|nr:hypothetical protein EBN03_26150 [Nocardia stercoris]
MTETDLALHAERIMAAGDCAPRVAPDPVNQPMIRHWIEAIGDDNPIYTDAAAAIAAGHPGVVAPPAMAQVWTMFGLKGVRPADDPLNLVNEAFDAAGFTSVVATDCEQTYHRYLRLGETVTVRSRLAEVTGPKQTGLGLGWFATMQTTWSVGDEVVTEMLFKVLKFAPGTAKKKADAVDPGDRVLPVISRDTEFFWNGTALGELRIQQLPDGTLRHPPIPALWQEVGKETDYVVAAGTGTVFSFVVHHAPAVPGRKRPFVIALVELDEGVRVLGELRGTPPSEVQIGQPVRVAFEQLDGVALPYWVPADAPQEETAPAPVAAEPVPAPEPGAPVRVGTVLPELVIDASATFIVSTALATRDFQDVHHDRDLAHQRGSADIFVNILTDTGLMQRFVTDWAGPKARIKSIALRLGVPLYAGDTLTINGKVTELADGVARVEVIGRDSLGAHVKANVVVALDEEKVG